MACESLAPSPNTNSHGLRILALELQGPFLYITHEMFHAVQHRLRKVPYLPGRAWMGDHASPGGIGQGYNYV